LKSSRKASPESEGCGPPVTLTVRRLLYISAPYLISV
jgi:hypothetical protein